MKLIPGTENKRLISILVYQIDTRS